MTDDDLREKVARAMHTAYEAAAADSGWETQEASRVPWDKVPEANKAAMLASARAAIAAVREAEADELDRLRSELADGSFYKESDIDRMQSHIALLRGAVHALLECPHIADRDPYPWNEPATEVAVDRARAALQETGK